VWYTQHVYQALDRYGSDAMTYYNAIAIWSGVGSLLCALLWRLLLRIVARICEHLVAVRRHWRADSDDEVLPGQLQEFMGFVLLINSARTESGN
jgi:hypothetical protein